MLKPNMFYAELKDSYLFYNIAQKTKKYLEEHPGAHLYRMGIGDVSLPLAGEVIKGLHAAADEQADKKSFNGYMPECGAPFLRKAVRDYYASTGVELSEEEVFISESSTPFEA